MRHDYSKMNFFVSTPDERKEGSLLGIPGEHPQERIRFCNISFCLASADTAPIRPQSPVGKGCPHSPSHSSPRWNSRTTLFSVGSHQPVKRN